MCDVVLTYLYNSPVVISKWVSEHIPHCHGRTFDHSKAIGVMDDDRLIAGIIYHNWEPEAGIIEISTAALPGSGWYTRETMAVMYQYPFHDLSLQMVIGRVKASDEALLRIMATIGYAFVLIPRFFGRHEDGVIATLTYEDWSTNKFNRRLMHHDLSERRDRAA
jgi:RimJ/RimL family protein N-acetyltransferase